jgi:gas vesicle protein
MARRDDRSNSPASAPTDLSANQSDRPGEGPMGGVREAKEELKDLASQAKEQTARVANQAKSQVGQLVTRQKDQAAERLQTLAEALREAGLKLAEREPDGFGRYADRAAQQVERLSDYVRRRDLNTVVEDLEGLARRHPDLFLGGALIAGVLLARFLKASAEPEPWERYPQPAYANPPYEPRERDEWREADAERSRYGGATGTYGGAYTPAAGGF